MAVLTAGTTAISIVSAIQVGFIASMAWVLLANAIIATQVIPYAFPCSVRSSWLNRSDGSPAAIAPLAIVAILFFVPTLYISLDTAFNYTGVFKLSPAQTPNLLNVGLFVLTLVWPLA